MNTRLLVVCVAILSLAGCDCAGPIQSNDGGVTPDAVTPDGATPDAFVPPIDGAQPDTMAPDAGPMCGGAPCGPGERCDFVGGVSTCVPNECSDLTCTATERCEPAPTDSGNVCVDVSCSDSLDCPTDEHCNGTICVADVCVGGSSRCVGEGVEVCADDGSSFEVRFTCGGSAYFTSACDDSSGVASCTCEDDWDCPAFTVCDAGLCRGTGAEAMCSLPPAPFASVLPSNEIQWGGTGTAARDAVGAPFPSSSQVSMTPLVVNLDDDNGDGRIDELDIAEVVFLSYCGTDVAVNGALRAIHGGGPNRGRDFFAAMGSTVWHEGDPLSLAAPCANGTANSTAVIAAGDLDGDGVPEIVVPGENDELQIHRNTGELITATPNTQWPSAWVNPAPSIANLDGAGLPELVVGNVVFTLGLDTAGALVFVDRFTGGTLPAGMNGQGPISCVANVAGGTELEVIGGSTTYRLPTPPAGVTRRAECAAGATDDFCAGRLSTVWDGQTVNGVALIPAAQRDGFCAVADMLGLDPALAPSPSNPLDGTPEVVLIAEGYLVILDGATGVRRRFINLGASTDGGAPNVDDFDGDGFPEIGTAFGTRYIAIDLQDTSAACPAWPAAMNDATPGTLGGPARAPGGACTMDGDCAAGAVCNTDVGACTCLHNGWMRITEDDSSRVTGSTVFDFNGDGAAELIYNDECFFRIYSGLDGAVLFKHPSPSRTRIENPVVADVDNDGNAEIVFSSNNDAASCSTGVNFPNGIAVWGDASDSWVSARRIWNQHAYHVTHVTESGAIPLREPESWRSYAGRVYDTYRSQPRSEGVAPDLTIERVQASSPDAMCGELGDELSLAVRVANLGDLRVGADVVLSFEGTWIAEGITEPLYADAAMTPLTTTLGATLEARSRVILSVAYDAAFNSPGRVPDRVRVVVDAASAERECDETNNETTVDVAAGENAADLAITVGTASGTCPSQTFPVTVENRGSLGATDVVLRLYAGDPAAGGYMIHEQVITGTLAPGATMSLSVTVSPVPLGAPVLVYGVLDPDDVVMECNDGNNTDAADATIYCSDLI